MPSHQDLPAGLHNTQAWRFAGLVQDRLTHPVGEKIMAIPVTAPGAPEWWNGGVFTFIAPNGRQIRIRNGMDSGGETWIDFSQDGERTWQRATTIAEEDHIFDMKIIAGVERPYMYGKMVNGEPWVVLGTCAPEIGTKGWDMHEREAPLAYIERLKDAPVRVVLAGNAEYAYKDGVRIQSPDGKGIYFGVTRHHIAGSPDSAVNADTILCQLDEQTGRYKIMGVLLPRAARGVIDKTCNRLSSELVFPDRSRFWGCDVRNAEKPNAASKNPLKLGDLQSWTLGDFDEITSFAIGAWAEGASFPTATSVNAILGRSSHPRYPTLRFMAIALLISADELAALASPPSSSFLQDNDAVILLTYERAGVTGAKSTFQQSITRKELADALAGEGPALLVGQDPIQAK